MARSKRILTTATLVTLLGPAAAVNQPTAAQTPFADPAFQSVWNRTDKLVADRAVQRSWYWGPTPAQSEMEAYAEGEGGKRLVQYFDKARMEINDPDADKNDPFYVTNGLLTVELISGLMQVGNQKYESRHAAIIPLASDRDDQNAPTYQSFKLIANNPLGDHFAPDRTGKTVIETVNRVGITARDNSKESYGVKYAFFNKETQHNIADKFWDFLGLSGPVLNANGQQSNAKLSDPWFYTTGFAISEPYWANVKIAGKQEDVLIQLFERRVLTYIPSYSPEWRVQMGNIGAHYYEWRYKGAGAVLFPKVNINPVSVPTGQLGSKERPIQMAFVPSSNTAAIKRTADPLAAQLGRITGYTFEASVPTSYAAVIEAMGSNNVDVAWLAPFSYALANQKYGSQVILSSVRRRDEVAYPSIFITADPNVKSIADLRGKKFAFVDSISSSGFLYPIAALKNLGFDYKTYFSETVFAGGHDRVVTAVYNGQVAGGAIFGGPIDTLTGKPSDARSLVESTFPDVYQKVRIIGETQLIPNDTVSVRRGLDPAMVRQIQQGLLELSTTQEGKNYLNALYRIDGLAPVTDSFYDPLRQVAADAGITNFEQVLPPTPTPRPPATPTP